MCDLLIRRSWWWVIIFRFSYTWVRTYIHTRTLLVLTFKRRGAHDVTVGHRRGSPSNICASLVRFSFFLFPSITPCCFFFFLPSTRSAVVVRRSFLFPSHAHIHTHTLISPGAAAAAASAALISRQLFCLLLHRLIFLFLCCS